MPNNRGTDCCSQILFNRGLKEASTWLLTLFNKQVFGFIETPLNSIQKVKFNLSLSQFYSNHFLLAAETASNSDHPILIFIHFYSIYNHLKRSIAHDSLSLDFPINDITPPDQSLFSDLYSQIMHLNSSDPFMLYLSALLKLNLAQPNLAIPLAISSIIAFPQNWSCWLLLSHCLETVENRNIYIDQIPDSVFKDAMIIQLGIDVPNEKSIIESKISNLELMFPDNFIVSSWRAIHCYNNREFNEAVCLFRDIFKKHPYSLDNLDLYSNVLYVLKLNEDLYSLAKDCMKLNKYTVSTCIVLANYYSSIKDYQKAIQFLHRALKLDPEYSQAWTLMGHEYIEQKNPNAAVTAYNRALELKSTDYRAWFFRII